jgi:hypothetical protein
MKVKFINFLNEAEIKETTIIFDDFANTYFGGDYDKMIFWLNDNLTEKSVLFISAGLEVLKTKYVVNYYYESSIAFRVFVRMKNGECGNAIGLVFLNLDADSIKLPNNKYKKIKNIELDPFDEEDWGYEEI